MVAAKKNVLYVETAMSCRVIPVRLVRAQFLNKTKDNSSCLKGSATNLVYDACHTLGFSSTRERVKVIGSRSLSCNTNIGPSVLQFCTKLSVQDEQYVDAYKRSQQWHLFCTVIKVFWPPNAAEKTQFRRRSRRNLEKNRVVDPPKRLFLAKFGQKYIFGPILVKSSACKSSGQVRKISKSFPQIFEKLLAMEAQT